MDERMYSVSLEYLRLFLKVFALVNKERTLEEIRVLLGKEFPLKDIYSFLSRLEENLRPPDLPPRQDFVLIARRRNARASATPAGKRLARYARDILASMQRYVTEPEVRGLETLVICAQPTAVTFLLPWLLRDYLRASRFTHIRVDDAETKEVVTAVAAEDADIGIGGTYGEPFGGVEKRQLFTLRRCLYQRRRDARHSVARGVTSAQLKNDTVITYHPEIMVEMGLNEVPAPTERGVRITLRTAEMIWGWVSNGIGLGLGYRRMAPDATDIEPVSWEKEALLPSGTVNLFVQKKLLPGEPVEKLEEKEMLVQEVVAAILKRAEEFQMV